MCATPVEPSASPPAAVLKAARKVLCSSLGLTTESTVAPVSLCTYVRTPIPNSATCSSATRSKAACAAGAGTAAALGGRAPTAVAKMELLETRARPSTEPPRLPLECALRAHVSVASAVR